MDKKVIEDFKTVVKKAEGFLLSGKDEEAIGFIKTFFTAHPEIAQTEDFLALSFSKLGRLITSSQKNKSISVEDERKKIVNMAPNKEEVLKAKNRLKQERKLKVFKAIREYVVLDLDVKSIERFSAMIHSTLTELIARRRRRDKNAKLSSV